MSWWIKYWYEISRIYYYVCL